MPQFRLTRNGLPLLEAALDCDSGSAPAQMLDLAELQPYGFEVEDGEDDTEYRLNVGDEVVDSPEAARGATLHAGRRHRRLVFWEDHPWFESARGFVAIALSSRSAADTDAWRPRLRIVVYVRPTKINEAQYRGLVAALSGLSAGLIFDVLGKSSRGLAHDDARRQMQPRPAHLELKAIESLWNQLRPSLAEIQRDPVARLTRHQQLAGCWGSERLSPSSVTRLAAQGVDPGHPQSPRPFQALRERLKESADTQEHRSIRGFLELVHARIRGCRASVEAHIAAIEAERPYRDRGSDGPSLYDIHDVPRLKRLRAILSHTGQISREVDRACRGRLFGRLLSDRALPPTPVFNHVAPYRRLRYAARRYLRSSLAVLDVGLDLRSKATSRMYEQWVFLQVATAFLRAGLSGSAVEQLIRQVEGARRFVVDLQHGTAIELQAPDDRVLKIRYEPHVFGRETARARGDSVYRGSAAESPWSPDVLIEFLRLREDRSHDLEAAVVVDAKYSRRPSEDQWHSAAKYHQIRHVRSGKQVVRQVWLAHPGVPEAIRPRDPAVSWTEDGPDWPRHESIDGVITALPPECEDEATEDALTMEAAVSPVFLRFAMGLLRQHGIHP